ncbi:50S ribosomal protein L25 [Candidatus Wolfebacteria bacterium CG10_big_fil_rev_8_21_14_0_10_31_9]|uniref:Large ribosomal subunit protein bL25 n=1 Tax=Candidatus Wolfebacteria bacterium CG10_big_fil_rev_8_21_14_0_10_31_9 TaxID=1975070 RepID=A0A2H0RCV6_9BACT|nr:MAG: 50S ribosomal protein L25 [Candidatus Wolfebacteria bacterium CG10_big_fil_rev_8_21_14_0_10_31_9]
MDLQVQKRDILGKKVKALRVEGLIPAELYGHGKENSHLSVSSKEFAKVLKEAGESTIVNLVLGKEKIPALIHDAQMDSIKQIFNHVDFYVVKMGEKIRTEIPLEFIGESSAVKHGGVLIKSIKEIEVEALPADLISHIDVDISKLEEIHSSIYVKDLKISDKIRVLVDLESVVATIIEQAAEEVEAPATSVADIKVEGDEKKKAEADTEGEKKINLSS